MLRSTLNRAARRSRRLAGRRRFGFELLECRALLSVTSTSPPFPNGTFLLPGPFTYDVNFSDPIDPASVQTTDLTVAGNLGASVSNVSVLPGNLTARFTISGIANEQVITASIAAGAITDSLGNPVPAFSASYSIDAGTIPIPTPLIASAPSGSMVYTSNLVSGFVTPVGDLDSLTLAVDPHQVVSVTVTPKNGDLQPIVSLIDPMANVLGTATATAAGKAVTLQPVSTVGDVPATYTIQVAGAGGTTGGYSVMVTLNSAIESEGFTGQPDDSPAAAQNIDASAVSLGGSATRMAVSGTVGKSSQLASQTFESGILPASFTTFSSNSSGRIRLAAPGGAGNSSSVALLMDSSTDNNYVLNEAEYTIDLSSVTQATLSFAHINFNDQADPLPANFTGHFNGDGVSISADGINWWTIFNATATDTNWTSSSIDLSAAAAAAGIPLNSAFKIKFQQYGNAGITAGGRGYDNISITTSDLADVYRFTLNAGDSVTAAIKISSGNIKGLSLQSATGTTLASSAGGSTNFDAVITDFIAPATGIYDVTVIGNTVANYNLVLTRNAEISTELNDIAGSAQLIASRQVAGDQFVLGRIATGNVRDNYQVNLPAGATLNLQTFTPADGAGEFTNTFNPRLRVLNTAGTQLALNDNGAADGRNAMLSFTNTGAAGTFLVEVSSTTVTSTQGEYVLRVTGNNVVLPSFHVTGSSVPDGSKLHVALTTISFDFNDLLLQSSLAASDLKVDGTPAAGFSVVDGNSVTFTLSAPLSDGNHTLTIAPGDINDIQGTPNDAYSAAFFIDTVAPRVVQTSLPPNAVVPPGTVSYIVTFSEPMRTNNIADNDFTLHGNFRGINYPAASFAFDPSATALYLSYNNLPDDSYTLTLLAGTSGGSNFTDPAGNALDGEFAGSFPSGDGTAGGNFAAGFSVAESNVIVLPPAVASPPLGSLVYSTSQTGAISFAGNVDSFTFTAGPGQTVSLLVSPLSGNLQPTVQLFDGHNVSVGAATATAGNQNALIQAAPTDPTSAETFTIVVQGAASSVGLYSIQVTLNALLENENYLAGLNNDTLDSAQPIDASLISLAGTETAKRAAVVGGNAEGPPTTSSTDFENGPAGYVVDNNYYVDQPGLWHLSTRRGNEPGHSGTTSFYYGLESTGTYDTGTTSNGGYLTSPPIALSSTGPIALGFNYVLQTQGNGSLFDLASVSVSIDGGKTFTQIASSYNADQLPVTDAWRHASFDLSAYAGKTIEVQFLFNTGDAQANDFGGWFVDDVQLTTPAAWHDNYSIQLNAGDSLSVGLKNASGAGTSVAILDPTGKPIAAGIGGGNFDQIATATGVATTGTYYVQVSGNTAVTYDLVATQNAALDTGANGSFAAAQPISQQHSVLGAFPPTRVGYFTDNVSTTVFDAPIMRAGYEPVFISDISTFDLDSVSILIIEENGTLDSADLQARFPDITQWVEEGGIFIVQDRSVLKSTPFAVGLSGVAHHDGLNQFGAGVDVIPPGTTGAITGPFGTVTNSTLSMVAYNGWVDAQSLPAGVVPVLSAGPDPSHLAAFEYSLGKGAVYYSTFSLYGYLVNDDPTSTLFKTVYVPNVLTYAYNLSSSSSGDWYTVDVSAGVQKIDLQTTTPEDGAGEFNNTLNPHIELLNPQGAVVATGSPMSDGRNESIDFQPLNSGAYRIHVSTENATAGEYVLNTRLLAVGDLNFDGVVNSADVASMMMLLTDRVGFQTKYDFSNADLEMLADIDHDGAVTNADLQALLNLGRQSTSGGGSSEVASSAVPSNPSEITSGYSNNADVVADSGNTMTMDGVSVSGVRLDVNANRDATGPVIRSARTPTAATALSLISRAVAPESSATPGLDDRVDRVEAIVGNVATQLSSTNELEYDQFWPKQRETTARPASKSAAASEILPAVANYQYGSLIDVRDGTSEMSVSIGPSTADLDCFYEDLALQKLPAV